MKTLNNFKGYLVQFYGEGVAIVDKDEKDEYTKADEASWKAFMLCITWEKDLDSLRKELEVLRDSYPEMPKDLNWQDNYEECCEHLMRSEVQKFINFIDEYNEELTFGYFHFTF